MNRVRIYTEDKNALSVNRIIGEHFNSYTVFPATGVWHGVSETSIIIEILTSCDICTTREKIASICQAIKKHNKQEAVLYTIEQDILAITV